MLRPLPPQSELQAHLTAVAGKIARLREGVKLTECLIEFLSPHYSLFHFS